VAEAKHIGVAHPGKVLNDPTLPPVDKPTLAIVAFGENSGGYGGTVTAPLVLQEWISGLQAFTWPFTWAALSGYGCH
jgi:hypothetical protein